MQPRLWWYVKVSRNRSPLGLHNLTSSIDGDSGDSVMKWGRAVGKKKQMSVAFNTVLTWVCVLSTHACNLSQQATRVSDRYAFMWVHVHARWCQDAHVGAWNWFHSTDCKKQRETNLPSVLPSKQHCSSDHELWAAHVHVRTCFTLKGRYTKTTDKLMLHVCCAVAPVGKWVMMQKGVWLSRQLKTIWVILIKFRPIIQIIKVSQSLCAL